MNRFFYIVFSSIAVIAILVLPSSCEKTSQQDETVSVYLTYTISSDNGEIMPGTKTTNAEVFNEFYQKIIAGDLVAPTYNLTFTETTTGTVYIVEGSWAGKDMVTLRTGTYKVVGTSTAPGENIQEKCSLQFDDEINVDVDSKSIVLKATYDCALIVFSDASIAKLSNYNGNTSTELFKFGKYFYAFIQSHLYADGKQSQAYLEGRHTNDTQFKIFTGNLNYEKGKYYIYNDINAAFNLDKMEEGGAEGQYVDLGLSVKWALCNVGASAPEESGNYYAWGETSQKDDYSLSTYKWVVYNNGWYLTKYCKWSEYWAGEGEMDRKETLDNEDDAAIVNWGGGWRMPTANEWEELLNSCTWTWTDDYNGTGIAGRIISSNKSGYTDKSIFLPAAGYRIDSGFKFVGMLGLYWASSLGEGYPPMQDDLDQPLGACSMGFSSDYTDIDSDYRNRGRLIRPVKD